MKPSQVATELRALADRFESLHLDDEAFSIGLELNAHRVNTREGLAKLVSLMNSPEFHSETNAVVAYDWKSNPVRIAAFFNPGLLGGKAKTIYVDDEAGLAALIAEHNESRYAESINAAVPAVEFPQTAGAETAGT